MVIIGATGVLGTLPARSLRAAGADVRLIARSPLRVAPDLKDLPIAAARIDERHELVAAFGEGTQGLRVDGIMNFEGDVAFGGSDELSDAVARQLFATNALGTVNVVSLAPHLNPEGFLASFTGVAGDMAIVGMGAYCGSKAVATTTVVVAARERRSRKVRVMDIRAPHTETGLFSRALEGVVSKMPPGLHPQVVVDRVLAALEHGEKDLPADAFSAA